MYDELDQKEFEHYLSFSYHDGLRDGQLSIYSDDGIFTVQENCIFLLLESGVDIKRIRRLFNLPEKSILQIQAIIKEHIGNMQKIKSRRAFERLQNAIEEV